jgi:hypothetical protein
LSATRKNLRDQVLRVLLGGPAYGSQIVERLPDEDPAGVRSAVRRLLRDHAIARGSDKRLSIALTVDDLRDLHARLDADGYLWFLGAADGGIFLTAKVTARTRDEAVAALKTMLQYRLGEGEDCSFHIEGGRLGETAATVGEISVYIDPEKIDEDCVVEESPA